MNDDGWKLKKTVEEISKSLYDLYIVDLNKLSLETVSNVAATTRTHSWRDVLTTPYNKNAGKTNTLKVFNKEDNWRTKRSSRKNKRLFNFKVKGKKGYAKATLTCFPVNWYENNVTVGPGGFRKNTYTRPGTHIFQKKLYPVAKTIFAEETLNFEKKLDGILQGKGLK